MPTMKTLADLAAGTTITPGEVWEIASANMEPEQIAAEADRISKQA